MKLPKRHFNFLNYLVYFNFSLLLFVGISSLTAQQVITIEGRVIDAKDNSPIPFANVFFKETTIGTTTDFEGYYKIKTTTPKDILVASYIGYASQEKTLSKATTQKINFKLTAEDRQLEGFEIVYKKWENPAWEVLRNVVEYKDKNNIERLSAYEFEKYIRTEMNLSNAAEKYKDNKAIMKALELVDSLHYSPTEDATKVLPVYISEEMYDYSYRKNPTQEKKDLKAKRIIGIAAKDGSFMNSLVGTSFLNCNFYDSWIRIMDRDFVSPVAGSWKTFYDYDLEREDDTLDNVVCYRISFVPKNDQDLAFSGVMWITKDKFAIRRIDVTTSKSANINYVSKIRLQQDLKLVDSIWMPEKTRASVYMSDMLIQYYTSNKNFVLNKPRSDEFYNKIYTKTSDEVINNSNSYWDTTRHEKIASGGEKNIFEVLDTLKKIPEIKRFETLLNFFVDGYIPLGKVDVGTYVFAYALNNVEGSRFQIDLQTNKKFSKRLFLSGYAGYGTKDKTWKYKTEAKYQFDKRTNTIIGLSYQYDIEQVGFVLDNINSSAINNHLITSGVYNNSTLFAASSRFGKLRRPYFTEIINAEFKTNLTNSVGQSLSIRRKTFDPLYNFRYFDAKNMLAENYVTTEIIAETRIATGASLSKSQNRQLSLRDLDYPIITFRITKGLNNVLGGNFDYEKYAFNIEQNVRVGSLGRTNYRATFGITPNTLPYPLLEAHLGNNAFFFNNNAFNMMSIFEFASDRYASLRIVHRFQGLIFNRIPLINKTNWREVITTNILFGSVTAANYENIPTNIEKGAPVNPLGYKPSDNPFTNQPYVESSFGIENIFKFLRIDFMYRWTYQDHTFLNHYGEEKKTIPFGIRVGGQISL
jgi:hypothetical protein